MYVKMKENLDNIVNVRIDQKLYDDLKKLSEKSDLNTSTLIRTILEIYVEQAKNNDDINQ